MSIDEDGPHGIPRTSILYQNPQRDVILIDIPTSIAVAQGNSGHLLSTKPLEAPIPLVTGREPKTPKAQAHTAQQVAGVDKHAEYKIDIQQALHEIRNHVSKWCLPRNLPAQGPQLRSTGQAQENRDDGMDIDDPDTELWERLHEWSAVPESKGPVNDNTFDFQQMMASLGATSEFDATSGGAMAQRWLMSYQPARDVHGRKDDSRGSSNKPWMSYFHNPEEHAVDLSVFGNASDSGHKVPKYSFRIPPQASFFLYDANHPNAFRTRFRQVTDDYNLPRHFDLVVMDPPWPNRSAKRKGAYEDKGGMPHIKRMLLRMNIDSYFEQNALVGIWITNKEALRHHVLGPGGLFEKWNIQLIEEWIWVKTTTKGDPMFEIENPLRKPYEVFLLGRAAPNTWTRMGPAPFIKKRVIAAVPDVHSRKPCLKELLEPYMPDVYDYTALEVFSRYLVTGWTSWGNEVIKFNWDKYWTPDDVEQARGDSMM
ncbi:MT-A70-domain-containing protein [Corynespora cassiicola Philippines]|uniref:MT-A70-domain-containing protein n=1 Tax=Corynespora cassiicola Philippines TaxID=1448308 RepID=A0A2T2P4X8_CORCC|nr:MT-A70-domain-containing protein [Corynespora cassiicola Philippines]